MSDLIYRQDAISLPVMPKRYRHYMSINLDDVYEQGWEDLQLCIEHMPSAQPVRKSAYLIDPNPYGKCSNCGQLIDIRDAYNYCPNCGYYIRGESE